MTWGKNETYNHLFNLFSFSQPPWNCWTKNTYKALGELLARKNTQIFFCTQAPYWPKKPHEKKLPKNKKN